MLRVVGGLPIEGEVHFVGAYDSSGEPCIPLVEGKLELVANERPMSTAEIPGALYSRGSRIAEFYLVDFTARCGAGSMWCQADLRQPFARRPAAMHPY